MKLIAILLVVLVGNALGESVQDLAKLSQDEYTARALAELKAMGKSRFLSDIQTPTCKLDQEELAIECSLKFRWMKVPRMIGVRAQINLNRLQLKFELLFDYEVLFEHKIDIGKICVPLPGILSKIKICAHAYYIHIDPSPPRLSFDACFLITLSPFLHLKLNCISLDKQGKWLHHDKYQPEDEGIIVLSIEDGNLKFKFNNPIPKEVMEQIERGWNEFEKGAKQAFDQAGKEFDAFGKDVIKGFDKVGRDFNKFGKDVETAFNQAGKDIVKFGKDVEQGFNKFGKDVEKGFNVAGKELHKWGQGVKKDFDKFGKDTKEGFEKFGKDTKEGFEKFGKDTKDTFEKFGKDTKEGFDKFGKDFMDFFG